ncbi:unnamed protein product [Rotaria sordida]|uniref:Uncharacterized protein n=1 Tax=Rotaria sordida TaxID=392033 RepID=A0A819XM69_9BILA|nr:unnamed protein product [Rotaria sordida]CAF1499942.1 unnamed protein product [Rotaria sordida]CAF3661330.1 unnamed protein product [Rotaria sordida]CAF4143991.1 unnamed protein product [Rotaria sordida]
MMIITFLLLIFPLINLITSQIPNPIRYRLTVTDNLSRQHYAIDKKFYKMSRKVYSLDEDPSSVSNSQTIYVPSEGRTYSFNLKSSPPCIANRGAPSNGMDYWADLVKGYGGENKTYDKIIIDEDCGGPCLTWLNHYDSTAVGYIIDNRLYIRQADSIPIKIISTLHDRYTGKFVSTTVVRFTDWNLRKIPDSEFEFPIDTKQCYFA